MRTLIPCAICGKDVATDKQAPVLCYFCWKNQHGSGRLHIDAAVAEICKAYGHAPHAGRSEIYDILNAFRKTIEEEIPDYKLKA